MMMQDQDEQARCWVAKFRLIEVLCSLKKEISNWKRNECKQAKAISIHNIIKSIIEPLKSANTHYLWELWLKQGEKRPKDENNPHFKRYFEDVALLYNSWGVRSALVLVGIQNIAIYYKHPGTRLKLLTGILQSEVCKELDNQDEIVNTSSGTKHVLDNPHNYSQKRQRGSVELQIQPDFADPVQSASETAINMSQPFPMANNIALILVSTLLVLSRVESLQRLESWHFKQSGIL